MSAILTGEKVGDTLQSFGKHLYKMVLRGRTLQVYAKTTIKHIYLL